jgi:hypothetical protein
METESYSAGAGALTPVFGGWQGPTNSSWSVIAKHQYRYLSASAHLIMLGPTRDKHANIACFVQADP